MSDKWTNVNDGLPEWRHEAEWETNGFTRKFSVVVDGWITNDYSESLEDGYRTEVAYMECNKHPEETGWYLARGDDFTNKIDGSQEVTHWIPCPAAPKEKD